MVYFDKESITYYSFYQLLLNNLQLCRCTHLTLSSWNNIRKIQFGRWSHFWEWGKSREWRKLTALWVKNEVTHAIQWKLHERMNKKQKDCGCIWLYKKSWRNKKNIAGQVLTQFKEILLTKQKKTTQSGLWMDWENRSENNQVKNRINSKNQCQNAAWEQKTTSES